MVDTEISETTATEGMIPPIFQLLSSALIIPTAALREQLWHLTFVEIGLFGSPAGTVVLSSRNIIQILDLNLTELL